MARTRHDAEWFWTDRWLGSSARELSMEARGLYREMLTAAWRRGANLPANHEAIRRLTACTEAEWERCWPAVKGYWDESGDGRLSNETQVEVYQKTLQLSETRATAGSAGGKASAKSRASAKQTLEQTAEQTPQAESKPPSPSPSPSPSPDPPPPSSGGDGGVLLEEAKCPACQARGTLRRSAPSRGGGWFCGTRLGGCGEQYELGEPAIAGQLTERARESLRRRLGGPHLVPVEPEPPPPEPPAADPDATKVWRGVLEQLDVPPHVFKTWLAPTRGVRCDAEVLAVWCPNDVGVSWIRKSYGKRLDELLAPRRLELIHGVVGGAP